MNNTLMIINILSVTYYTFTGIVFIFILLGIITMIHKLPLLVLNIRSNSTLLLIHMVPVALTLTIEMST